MELLKHDAEMAANARKKEMGTRDPLDPPRPVMPMVLLRPVLPRI